MVNPKGHLIVPAQDIGIARARQRLGLRIAFQHGCRRGRHRRRREQQVHHVGGHAGVGTGVAGPVKAQLAKELVGSGSADHDVIAGFGIEVVVAIATDQNVMADDRAVDAALDRQTLHQVTVVTQDQVVGAAGFQPVVAFAAHDHAAADGTMRKVIVLAGQDVIDIGTAPDEVAAGVGDDQVEALTRGDHVIAAARADLVIAEFVGDDVIALAAEEEVIAFAAFQTVVAGIAPEGIVALAADQDVIAIRAAQNHMFRADVTNGVKDAIIVCVAPDDFRHHRRQHHVAAFGRIHVPETRVELLGLVHLDVEVGGREHVARQVRGRGVAVDHFGELVVLHLRRQVQVGQTRQVVEPVGILQRLKLHFEDEVEGRAQHAAEHHLLFGKTADPEIDIVQPAKVAAGIGTLRQQEVQPVSRSTDTAQHQIARRVPLAFKGRRRRDRLMLAIGRDEVDDRGGVLDVQREVIPAGIGFDLGIRRSREELGAGLVQRGHTHFAATGDVDRGQVKRQADQVVAQRFGDEFVDLVAALAGHAAGQGPGGLIGSDAAGGVFDRVQEGRDQIDVVCVVVRVQAIHAFVQHRVAEAVDGMGKFAQDRRVKLPVEADEEVDEGLNLAGKLFEHQVLVLHLGDELGRLEHPLAVPGKISRQRKLFSRCNRHHQPFVQELGRGGNVAGRGQNAVGIRKHDRFHRVDLPVVLGMEHMVHGGQRDVLIGPAIAANVVKVQQFVVIGASCLALQRRADSGVDVSGLAAKRIGVARDVVQEGMARRDGAHGADRRGDIAFDRNMHAIHKHHDLRKAVRAANEVAIGIRRQQRHVMHVHIVQLDPQNGQGLRLHIGPGRQTATRGLVAVQQPARGDGLAIDQFIFAQEHLVRGMRGIGLVLIDIGRDLVDRLAVLVQRPAGHDHEVGVGGQGVVQRIIRLQRDVDGPEATFCSHVEAVVKELAEDRHQGVEGGRQAFVRCDVGNDHGQFRQIARRAGLIGQAGQVEVRQDLCLEGIGRDGVTTRGSGLIGGELGLDDGGVSIGICAADVVERGNQHRGVVHGLINDQVRNDARVSVDNVARLDRPRPQGRIVRRLDTVIVVGQNGSRPEGHQVVGFVQKDRRRCPRELLIGGTIGFLAGDQVVVAAVNAAQAPGQFRRGDQRPKDLLAACVRFSNLDLLKDEFQIRSVDRNHDVHPVL